MLCVSAGCVCVCACVGGSGMLCVCVGGGEGSFTLCVLEELWGASGAVEVVNYQLR